MHKRRTAEDALNANMTSIVREFIDRGVTHPPTPAGKHLESLGADSVAQQDSGVIELPADAATSPRSSKRKSSGASVATRQPIDELARTYARATVQKTIRFHPKLIAELEAYTREQEVSGEKPTTFQQVQNEALDLWLQKHVR